MIYKAVSSEEIENYKEMENAYQFDKAIERLNIVVNENIQNGFEPIGGIISIENLKFKGYYILSQAMIKQ